MEVLAVFPGLSIVDYWRLLCRGLLLEITVTIFCFMENEQTQPTSPEFSGKLVRPPLFYKQWMIAGNPAFFFDRLVNDFGDFIHYRGLFNFYLVNHPTLVKQILQGTNQSFDKNSVIYNRFRNAFGDGLVVAEGERWKRQRKLMQPIFGAVAVKRFFELMVDSATAMTHRWESTCRNKAVFDIAEEMNQITLEIAGRSLFHDGFDQAGNKIAQWTRTINHYSAKPPLPIIRSFWFPSRRNFKLKATLKEFHAFLREMIVNRRTGKEQDDLLSILLRARDEESGLGMSDLEIMEEALGMIIGGHETSSSALAWIWYELHQHPEVQKQLHDEIDAVVGKAPLKLEDMPRLQYAKMIINETLRLHPPFWFENRNVMHDIELGGARLPKGSLVAFSRYSLHRHPAFWQNPDQFNPERFYPDREENKRSTYAHVPFGGGPRICIGIHFAMMELVIILVSIAQRYKVVVDAQNRHQMAASLTMTQKYGLKVRLEPR
jgi:cytochrome P450